MDEEYIRIFTLFKNDIYRLAYSYTKNYSDTDDKDDSSLIDSLMQLPKKYRIVLFLFYYEDYKIKEISEILNLNESTIKTRLSRAKSLLKDVLKGGIANE